MKKFLTIITLIISFNAFSQDPIRHLLISEVRMDFAFHAYIELTNMGVDPVELGDFGMGRLTRFNDPWNPATGNYMRLPSRILQPGESFVIANAYDYNPEQYPIDPDNFREKITKDDHLLLADLLIHQSESQGAPTDEVSEYAGVTLTFLARDVWYLDYHMGSDSVVVDQVNGVFDEVTGRISGVSEDVAGVPEALKDHILVRRSLVHEGNVDFEIGRGLSPEDSEWIPIPIQQGTFEPDRPAFWTLGNHGAYVLEEGILQSSTINIDWNSSELTVPWGTLNKDRIMLEFEKHPGIAWDYILSSDPEDSTYTSCRTGDILRIYVAGDDPATKDFNIILSPPAPNEARVIPKNTFNETGESSYPQETLFTVSSGSVPMDTISQVPFACRVDTLYKYLEKADNATWEIIWKDGMERVDLVDGDLLRITAEDQSVKNYYIQTYAKRLGDNALLAAITWPDIPSYQRNSDGWSEDTIPDFDPNEFEYTIDVPAYYEGIPAFAANPADCNALVEIQRATSLRGLLEDKEVHITVSAEDGITTTTYTLILNKLKMQEDIQPNQAEPFISQFVYRDQGSNGFLEIYNPSNELIDMSQYMIVGGNYNSSEEAITSLSGVSESARRYEKYIPGFKWRDEFEWALIPGVVELDPHTNPIVKPGDVFVIADIRNTTASGYPWHASLESDIDFGNNPWEETIEIRYTCANQFAAANYYLFKLVGDSVLDGLKPAIDPNDFVLLDVFGSGDGSTPVVGGVTMISTSSYIRKQKYIQGNTSFNASFGTTPEDSEWEEINRNIVPRLEVTNDIGRHTFDEITTHSSTISSSVYICSEGYSMNESIQGVLNSTTLTVFLPQIIREDPGQTLVVRSISDDHQLSGTEVLSDGDYLEVESADGKNTTRYYLEVSAEGLSNDAVLTSSQYTISVDGSTGSIGDFDFGTDLNTLLGNLQIPEGARLTPLNSGDEAVPLYTVNSHGMQQPTMASIDLKIEVIAEDNSTVILYSLAPTASIGDAYVLSNVYEVDEVSREINTLPDQITVSSFLKNIIPVNGADISILDKTGFERPSGIIAFDDKLKVVSADGSQTRFYFLSCERETQYDRDMITIYPGIDKEVCSGESLVLNVSGDLFGNYSISWDHGISNGEEFIPPASDDYIVTVTNPFGSSYDTVHVEVNPLPISNLPDQSICPGEEVTLTATGGVSHIWDQGVINGIPFKPENTSEYHVTATSDKGCTVTDSVKVVINPLPTLLTGEDVALCAGEKVTLLAVSDGNATWDHDISNGVPFVPEASANYHITATSDKGCISIDTISITVKPLPNLDAGEDVELCSGEELTLTATSDGSINWVEDVNNGIPFIPETSGAYHVSSTSDLGCTTSDTVSITVHPLPEANAGPDVEICKGESLTLEATGGSSYVWNNGLSNGDSFTPERDSSLEVTVSTEFGCSATDALFITLIQVDTSVTLNGTQLIANTNEATYQWIDCANGEAIPGAVENSFTPSSNGTYAVEVTHLGCMESSSCYEVTGIVSVHQAGASEISCYPNPTKGLLNLDLGQKYDQVLIRICNLSGKLLLSKTFYKNSNFDLDLSTYNPGFYILEAITPEDRWNIKVLKVE